MIAKVVNGTPFNPSYVAALDDDIMIVPFLLIKGVINECTTGVDMNILIIGGNGGGRTLLTTYLERYPQANIFCDLSP